MKDKYLFVAALFLFTVAVGVFVIGGDIRTQKAEAQVGLSFQANSFIRFATSGIATIPASAGNTDQLVIATNTKRLYLAIVNDCTSVVYLRFGGETVSGSIAQGMRLNANGGSGEFNERNLYRGAIHGTTTSSTACDLTVAEK